jgi:hypothetical protein
MFADHVCVVAPEPRTTALGGLKRLGTVMGRRKSVVHTPGGGPLFGDKKHRSPFASFKRGDSRDMQIPESPTGTDRPGTALTTQDSHGEAAPIPSEIHERELPGSLPTSPEPQHIPATTNGGSTQEVHNELTPAAALTANEVCVDDMNIWIKLTTMHSRESTRKGSRNDRRPLTR